MEHAPQDSTVTSDVSTQFRLRSEAIRAAIDFKREHDPVFKGLTLCDLADKCRIGRSTFKRIVNGTTTDANCSTIAMICEGLGIDPAVVFGLAPSRDYQREAAEYNPTLMDNMRRQNIALEERLGEKRARIEELTAEIADAEKECTRLRKMYNEKCIELSASQTRMEAVQTSVEKSSSDKLEIKKLRTINNVLTAVLIALIAAIAILYLIWEISHPNLGMTGLVNKLLG